MRLPNPNKLLVEGDEDKRVIPQLIEANGIRWGERRDECIVEIEAVGGIDELLRPGSIRTELGQRNLERLGIILDADDDPLKCWQRVRKECLGAFPDFPDSPQPEGTIVQDAEGKKLGVWIMPDNQSRGMLETLLAYLVPDELGALWAYVQEVLVEARNRAASYGDTQRDKPRSTPGWRGRTRPAASSTTPCCSASPTRARRWRSRSLPGSTACTSCDGAPRPAVAAPHAYVWEEAGCLLLIWDVSGCGDGQDSDGRHVAVAELAAVVVPPAAQRAGV